MKLRGKLFYPLLGVLLIVNLFSIQISAGNLDKFIRDGVQDTDKGLLDSSMQTITYLGDETAVAIMILTLPDRQVQLAAGKSVLLSAVTVQLIKAVIGKKRPPGPVEYRPFTLDSDFHSMPSGHTASAFALATIIANYYPDYQTMAYTLATLVGASRLYEDQHWFSDVFIGAGIGYLSSKVVLCEW